MAFQPKSIQTFKPLNFSKICLEKCVHNLMDIRFILQIYILKENKGTQYMTTESCPVRQTFFPLCCFLLRLLISNVESDARLYDKRSKKSRCLLFFICSFCVQAHGWRVGDELINQFTQELFSDFTVYTSTSTSTKPFNPKQVGVG